MVTTAPFLTTQRGVVGRHMIACNDCALKRMKSAFPPTSMRPPSAAAPASDREIIAAGIEVTESNHFKASFGPENNGRKKSPFVSLYLLVCIYMYVCKYVYVYLCMYVYIFIYVCMYVIYYVTKMHEKS